jgi:hypothetical protein
VTTTTSQLPAVTDYLVAAAAASAALAGVSIFDGPQPVSIWQSMEQVLFIGADPANLTEATGDVDQAFATALDSGRLRDEDGVITCAAQHWSGDTTIKPHRDGAAAIVAGAELLLRGTPAKGGPGDASMGGLCLWSQVTGPYQWYPSQRSSGAAVLVVFRISYRARLVTS